MRTESRISIIEQEIFSSDSHLLIEEKRKWNYQGDKYNRRSAMATINYDDIANKKRRHLIINLLFIFIWLTITTHLHTSKGLVLYAAEMNIITRQSPLFTWRLHAKVMI